MVSSFQVTSKKSREKRVLEIRAKLFSSLVRVCVHLSWKFPARHCWLNFLSAVMVAALLVKIELLLYCIVTPKQRLRPSPFPSIDALSYSNSLLRKSALFQRLFLFGLFFSKSNFSSTTQYWFSNLQNRQNAPTRRLPSKNRSISIANRHRWCLDHLFIGQFVFSSTPPLFKPLSLCARNLRTCSHCKWAHDASQFEFVM